MSIWLPTAVVVDSFDTECGLPWHQDDLQKTGGLLSLCLDEVYNGDMENGFAITVLN